MLSSVLNCEKAIQINILIMRTFVKIREFLYNHKDLAQKIQALERTAIKNSSDIQIIFEAIKQLIAIEEKPKNKIGFLRN